MSYKRTFDTWRWEAPEVEDWDEAERSDDTGDRCLPAIALFIAATGPFVFCYPRRMCYPRGFCSPRSYCNPYYFCYPRPCFPS